MKQRGHFFHCDGDSDSCEQTDIKKPDQEVPTNWIEISTEEGTYHFCKTCAENTSVKELVKLNKD